MSCFDNIQGSSLRVRNRIAFVCRGHLPDLPIGYREDLGDRDRFIHPHGDVAKGPACQNIPSDEPIWRRGLSSRTRHSGFHFAPSQIFPRGTRARAPQISRRMRRPQVVVTGAELREELAITNLSLVCVIRLPPRLLCGLPWRLGQRELMLGRFGFRLRDTEAIGVE
jgi:hypothetical protein